MSEITMLKHSRRNARRKDFFAVRPFQVHWNEVIDVRVCPICSLSQELRRKDLNCFRPRLSDIFHPKAKMIAVCREVVVYSDNWPFITIGKREGNRTFQFRPAPVAPKFVFEKRYHNRSESNNNSKPLRNRSRFHLLRLLRLSPI